MKLRPPLYLGVVVIEKGVFGSPSNKVANFFFFYTFLVVVRRRTAYENWVARVSWTKRTTCHEDKESVDTDFEFSFYFSVVITCLFAGSVFASGMRPLFEAYRKMGASTFDHPHIILVSIHSHLYLFASVYLLWEPYPSYHNGLFSP